MPSSKVTSKGQITLPKSIREYLHIETGDEVDFVVCEGRVEMRLKTIPIESLIGVLKSKKSVSVEQMDQAIKRRMKRKYLPHDRD